MRSLTVHPASLVIGLAFVMTCLLSATQNPRAGDPRIEVLGHPRNYVQIKQGTAFVVPAGQVFVLTGLGTDLGQYYGGTVSLFVDGHRECRSAAFANEVVAPLSVSAVPPGLTAYAGSTITVMTDSPSLSGRAWGYVMKASPSSTGGTEVVSVQFSPRPEDMMRIVEGSSFVVPPGKLFVLTALGGTNAGGLGNVVHALRVNGTTEVVALEPYSYELPPLAQAPPGFAVPGGSTIEAVQLAGAPSSSRAWGYLAPQ
jgi:hypothetical protein